ncbi:unnamed protein product, partial [Discosporangium mesarthrocarpum]
FIPSEKFDGARPRYVFKVDDQGLGYYVEGYIPTKTRRAQAVHRPWNAGPGEEAITRGPFGPLKEPATRHKLPGVEQDEREDAQLFMARMIAQRDSRSFQSTLLSRQNALDQHILSLLEGFADPKVFRKQHGYNIHGQMLGKDGKMIEKASM